jgi:hypothetical protein
MSMTPNELAQALKDLKPGTFAAVPYDLYAELFPPGEPDERAREACYNFAKAHGCRVENKSDSSVVWLVKDN